jgi:hypothetical protein
MAAALEIAAAARPRSFIASDLPIMNTKLATEAVKLARNKR